MSVYECNYALEERLRNLREGLHRAMTALITEKNFAEAEVILKQMDQHMATTLANLDVAARLGSRPAN